MTEKENSNKVDDTSVTKTIGTINECKTLDERIEGVCPKPHAFVGKDGEDFIHEPPIGGKDGSFILDFNQKVSSAYKVPNTNITRYTFVSRGHLPNTKYTGVYAFSVSTKMKDNTTICKTYCVPVGEQEAKLIVDLDTTNGDRAVTIPGGAHSSVDFEMNTRNPPKIVASGISDRKDRFKHHDTGAKILGWRIVDINRKVIEDSSGENFSHSGGEKYEFFIHLNHIPRHK